MAYVKAHKPPTHDAHRQRVDFRAAFGLGRPTPFTTRRKKPGTKDKQPRQQTCAGFREHWTLQLAVLGLPSLPVSLEVSGDLVGLGTPGLPMEWFSVFNSFTWQRTRTRTLVASASLLGTRSY